MTRRTIDIDDEVWRSVKIDAAAQGITVKELVADRLVDGRQHVTAKYDPNSVPPPKAEWKIREQK